MCYSSYSANKVENGYCCIQATLLNPDECGPYISVRIRQHPDYAYRIYMYRKELGPSNPDNTCTD